MVGAGLKDGMASTEVRTGSMFGELVSGNDARFGESITTGEIEDLAVTTAKLAAGAVTNAKITAGVILQDRMTTVVQSGTYNTGGAETYTSFATAFAAAPTVVVSPTESAGLEVPIVTTVAPGSVGISGAVAHTGAYLAFGVQA